MSKVRNAAPNLEGMDPYDPKYLPADIFMSANESPLDVPGPVRDQIIARLRELPFNRYPDPLAKNLRAIIADAHGVLSENVLIGNGGDELLFDLFAAYGGPGRSCLSFPPTFSVYEADARITNTSLETIARCGADSRIDVDATLARLERGDIDIVIVTSPNNPTGNATPTEDIERILEATDAIVCVDEAYGEFCGSSALPLLLEYENLMILRTFSKAYRLAGVRLGYILANAFVLDEFKKVRQPYSVDTLSQVVGEEVMRSRDLFVPGIASIIANREALAADLSAIEGVTVHKSDANFLLFYVEDADDVWARLYNDYSILVRNVSKDPLLPGCLRVTVCTADENSRFTAALREIVAS